MPRPLHALAGLAAAIVHTLAAAGPAHAAAYRYWTYWTGTDGAWSFATAGPTSIIPADGSVQGWRFAVTTDSGTAAQPRQAADFDTICASTPAEDGRKRVALVVDPGDPAEAPEGQTPGPIVATCVVADTDATGYQVLRSVSTVRVEKGLVCDIGGYPAGECAPVVDDATPVASATASQASTPATATTPVGEGSAMDTSQPATADTGGGSPWALVAVAGFVALIVGSFFWRRRRA